MLSNKTKTEILKLRQDGLSYRKIANVTNVNISSIAHLLNHTGKTHSARSLSDTDHILFKKKYVWRYKQLVGCSECDEHDAMFLDMDHIDQASKKYNVSYMVQHNYSMTTLKDEIRKCRVLCVKCHRRHTFEQLGYDTFYN